MSFGAVARVYPDTLNSSCRFHRSVRKFSDHGDKTMNNTKRSHAHRRNALGGTLVTREVGCFLLGVRLSPAFHGFLSTEAFCAEGLHLKDPEKSYRSLVSVAVLLQKYHMPYRQIHTIRADQC